MKIHVKTWQKCPKCGGKLIQRAIDTAEKIMDKRLPDYYANTVPAIEFMREQGILHELDGRPTIPEVAKSVAKIVDPVAQKLS